VQQLGHVDILVNNASVQHYCDDVTNITPEQLTETFTTNVFGYFYFAQVRPMAHCSGASAAYVASHQCSKHGYVYFYSCFHHCSQQ
jgi:NAD(P)-dependent dehydrogenase (short-subunit alcohol dehydrogenase family)